MASVEGKVAVVTGAGSGMGRATALELARRGATVAACDINGDSAKATVDEANAADGGGKSTAHEVDVSSEAAMRALVDDVVHAHGQVDIVVNVAGIAMAPATMDDLPLEKFRRLVDVNLWGVIYGSLFFLPHLKRRPWASLVNVASASSLVGICGYGPYTTTKFGVRGFTETLRMELAAGPVKVGVVYPGSTRTAIFSNSPLIEEQRRDQIQASFDRYRGASPEAVARRIVGAVESGRPRVLIGPDTRGFDVLARLLPGSYSRLLHRPLTRIMESAFNS